MENVVDVYKEISKEILGLLKEYEINNDKLNICFEKRQTLIDNLIKENKIEQFKEVYKDDLYNIDIEIKKSLQYNITEVKKEIVNYKKNKSGNFAYANMNKLNLNIFSKKV